MKIHKKNISNTWASLNTERVIMVSLTTPCLYRWSMKRGYVIFWVVSKLIIIAYETKCQTNFQYLCICLQAPCFGDILRNKSICILRENFCIFVDSSFLNTHRCLQEKCHTSVCNRFWNTFSRNNIGKKSRDVLYSSRIALKKVLLFLLALLWQKLPPVWLE